MGALDKVRTRTNWQLDLGHLPNTIGEVRRWRIGINDELNLESLLVIYIFIAKERFCGYLHGSSINFNPVVLLSGRGSIGGPRKLNSGDATGVAVGAISNNTTFDRADNFGEVLL